MGFLRTTSFEPATRPTCVRKIAYTNSPMKFRARCRLARMGLNLPPLLSIWRVFREGAPREAPPELRAAMHLHLVPQPGDGHSRARLRRNYEYPQNSPGFSSHLLSAARLRKFHRDVVTQQADIPSA